MRKIFTVLFVFLFLGINSNLFSQETGKTDIELSKAKLARYLSSCQSMILLIYSKDGDEKTAVETVDIAEMQTQFKIGAKYYLKAKSKFNELQVTPDNKMTEELVSDIQKCLDIYEKFFNSYFTGPNSGVLGLTTALLIEKIMDKSVKNLMSNQDL